MSIVVVGLNHRTAPVEVRENFAYGEHAVPVALEALKKSGWVEEAVLLSTCNRVELYASVAGDSRMGARRLREFLGTDRRFQGDIGAVTYTHLDGGCLEHLFRVAGGLDSLVLGETEILGQLKKAYDLALRGGFTGKVLNQAFQRAFSMGKLLRSETQIQRGNTSVASVAVELAEKIFDDLKHREVIILGAGDMGEKTARALLSRGARSLMVSNRSFDRAAALAEELGGRAVHFDEWEREFQRVDILVSSTSAPHYVVDRARLERLMPSRPARPLLLIDLAVPRDIDPEVEKLDDVFLYNVDHLQTVADQYARLRRAEVARCEDLIRARVAQWTGGEASGGRLGPAVPVRPA
jgi:glutamyl-tRNA reductase